MSNLELKKKILGTHIGPFSGTLAVLMNVLASWEHQVSPMKTFRNTGSLGTIMGLQEL